jgi:MinD-like ATPase involved in chromosome partitioning or flagellar assembly
LLIALWSATGGSGTSVFTAACALVLARQAHEAGSSAGVRVADLAGDLPAVFGVGADPDVGLADWLDAGAEAPTEALDRLLTEVVTGVALLPRGRGPRVPTVLPPPESGAALAVALSQGSSPVLVDCGTAREPAVRALVEVADLAVVVLRPCYLALRRAVHAPALAHTTGVVLLDEPGRSLGVPEIGEVLDRPVLGRIPLKEPIARAVDAGVLPTRLPEPLARAATDVVRRLGLRAGRRGEAA